MKERTDINQNFMRIFREKFSHLLEEFQRKIFKEGKGVSRNDEVGNRDVD